MSGFGDGSIRYLSNQSDRPASIARAALAGESLSTASARCVSVISRELKGFDAIRYGHIGQATQRHRLTSASVPPAQSTQFCRIARIDAWRRTQPDIPSAARLSGGWSCSG